MISAIQGWLFETVIQPVLFTFGWMTVAEPLFDMTEWLVLGVIETLVLALVLGALERRWPVETTGDTHGAEIA